MKETMCHIIGDLNFFDRYDSAGLAISHKQDEITDACKPCICPLLVTARVPEPIVSVNIRDNLRVLGYPNPGQSFGRGMYGPEATGVKM